MGKADNKSDGLKEEDKKGDAVDNFIVAFLKQVFECRLFGMFIVYFILFNLDYSQIPLIEFNKIPYPESFTEFDISMFNILIPLIMAAFSFPFRVIVSRIILFIEEDLFLKSETKKKKWIIDHPDFMKDFFTELDMLNDKILRLDTGLKNEQDTVKNRDGKIANLQDKIANLEEKIIGFNLKIGAVEGILEKFKGSRFAIKNKNTGKEDIITLHDNRTISHKIPDTFPYSRWTINKDFMLCFEKPDEGIEIIVSNSYGSQYQIRSDDDFFDLSLLAPDHPPVKSLKHEIFNNNKDQ